MTEIVSTLRGLFRSVRPPHAFVLSRDRLVYVGRRDARGRPSAKGTALTFLSRPLPAGALRADGPGGVPAAGPELARAVSALAGESGGRVSAASLVVPDDFVRLLTVDVESPGQSPKEIEEILLWKFGRVFGEPAPPLRLAWQEAGSGTEGTRFLAAGTPWDAAASWEGAFGAAGVRIGSVETASLAVATLGQRLVTGDGFLIWADGAAATTVFFRGGMLRFVRTKETSDPEEALQEIRLAVSFVQGDARADGEPGFDVSGPCAAGPPGSPIIDRFLAFRAENGGPPPKVVSLAALSAVAPELAGLGDAPPGTEVLLALGAMAGGE